MAKIRNIATGVITEVEETPRLKAGIWECGDQRFTDSTGSLYEIVVEVVPPTVSVATFLLSFTSAERVKARALRSTDPILDDFWLVLDKATNVDLSWPSVQDGVEYTLTVVKAAGLTTLDIPARKASILNGITQ